ncbi:hypothetical protein D6783_01215 [Candidatus Woesearchaeota archaeon]|nr:MAG: hypothetical protein D6783_01215 [Candidatus Woesearchaeota archaeon]
MSNIGSIASLIQKDDDLLAGIEQLYQQVTRLIRMLETANESMLKDYEAKEQRFFDQTQQILDQNTKIAQAILSLANKFSNVENTFQQLIQALQKQSTNESPYEGLKPRGTPVEDETLPWQPKKDTSAIIHDPDPEKNIPDEDPVPKPFG